MKYMIIALACAAASPLAADITVQFQESAPKDRFVIAGAVCELRDVALTIDLARSAGGLIFDVTAAGAGVEVFQPVEVQAGAASVSPVSDGQQELRIAIPLLAAGTTTVISADLDDVLADSSLGQIRVAGSELDGAVVQFVVDGTVQTAAFSDGSNIVTFSDGCLS